MVPITYLDNDPTRALWVRPVCVPTMSVLTITDCSHERHRRGSAKRNPRAFKSAAGARDSGRAGRTRPHRSDAGQHRDDTTTRALQLGSVE